MAGGTWTTQNKVRPGVYINIRSEAQPIGALGERGVATIALPLSWGPSKQVVTIEAGQNVFDVLGYDITAPQLLLVREVLKRARTLLLYRLNEGDKATANIGSENVMTVTAKYSGVRGNDISIVVQANVDNPNLFEVQTLVDGREVDLQTVSSIEELEENAWVTFSGTGAPEPTAGVNLAGGTDGSVTNADYMAYLEAIELHDFNTMAAPVDDETLKSVFVAFVKRMREDEGKKIQVVLPDYATADYEGVISVKNGVVLADGTVLNNVQATAWVAGATAGANVNQSLTYAAYDGAVDVDTRYTHTQIVQALQNGEFLFVPSDGRAIVEQDINTFTSFTPEKRQHFSKNRVIRVLDSLGNDLKRIFEQFYIGKVNNDDDGRNLFKNEIINYLNAYQNIGAIQNFDPQADIQVSQGNDVDSVYVELYVQPIDSAEKIYMNIIVR
ncbi:MAG TPA: phage tail sheath family protein [Ohtaekwangia sp.]|nr:phage tail sheath family protein [Ohtaekwangia sp.]